MGRISKKYFWMLGILLLAAMVRFVGINAQSFWIDEAFTWNLTQYSNMFTILQRDVHPPLYFLMIDVWVELTGTSEVAMRYFSLLPSLISVAVVYQLAREIETQRGNQNSLIPLIAAALMAIAEAETFLSQEARSYTWHVLWACVSMWGFLRYSRLSDKQSLAVWILSTIALIYTFYLGAFVGIAQGIYTLLFLRGRQRLIAIIALVICAISLAPWLAWTGTEQSENISRGEVILPEAYGFWLQDFRDKYFTGQWALMLALAVSGLVIAQKRRWTVHQSSILLLLWLGVPLLITLYLNGQVPTYQPRRVSQIVPAIALLTAFGLGNIQGKVRWFLLIVIVIYGTFSVDFGRFKQPWREMVADTVALIRDGTPMLFEVGGDDYAPRYHYHRALPNSHDFLLDDGEPDADANVLLGLTTWRHLQPESYAGNLPAIIDSQDHWWFFYWSNDVGALNWLDTFGFQRSATITVDFNPDVFLYRYDRLPDDAIAIYENGLVLRDAILHDDLTVELLWSTERPITVDYVSSAYLLDESGQLVAQFDSQPFFGERPMGSWQINEVIYDPKPMVTNQDLSMNDYQVELVVYQLIDGEIVRLLTSDGEREVRLGEMRLHP